MSIVYRTPESKEEFEEYFDFRWESLRKPISLARGSEQDEFEDTAFHIAAFYSEKIIGVLEDYTVNQITWHVFDTWL